jgi:hypothetical protein
MTSSQDASGALPKAALPKTAFSAERPSSELPLWSETPAERPYSPDPALKGGVSFRGGRLGGVQTPPKRETQSHEGLRYLIWIPRPSDDV